MASWSTYGSSGVNRHDHADVHYLSGFLGNRNNYVVITAQGEPAIYVQSFNHVVTHDERAGVQLGNLFRITHDSLTLRVPVNGAKSDRL